MFCHIFGSLFYVRSLQKTYYATSEACITILNHGLILSFYYTAYVWVNSTFYCIKLLLISMCLRCLTKNLFSIFFVKSRVSQILGRTYFTLVIYITMLPLNQMSCPLDFWKTLYWFSLTTYFNIFHFCYIVLGNIFLFYYMCWVFERVALSVNCIFIPNNVFYCVAL